jgi:hypothetical protein
MKAKVWKNLLPRLRRRATVQRLSVDCSVVVIT